MIAPPTAVPLKLPSAAVIRVEILALSISLSQASGGSMITPPAMRDCWSSWKAAAAGRLCVGASLTGVTTMTTSAAVGICAPELSVTRI